MKLIISEAGTLVNDGVVVVAVVVVVVVGCGVRAHRVETIREKAAATAHDLQWSCT